MIHFIKAIIFTLRYRITITSFTSTMELKSEDLNFLMNQKNKMVYDTFYDLVCKEFSNVLKDMNFTELNELKIESLGTCAIYLSSMVELLHTVKALFEDGYIESAGTIAAALWERALTLRKILIDPKKNSQIHVEHSKAKKTPWSVWQMLNDVIDSEHKKKPKARKEIETKLFYLQYTFLSSIKHGNPYTISYLNRPDKSSNLALYQVKPNDSVADKDLKFYIKLLIADICLEALEDFTRAFRPTNQTVMAVRTFANELISKIPLNVPTIFITDPEEMGQEFWDHLVEIDRRIR